MRNMQPGVSLWIYQISVKLSKGFTVDMCCLTADAEDVSVDRLIKADQAGNLCNICFKHLNYTSTVCTVKNTQTIM